MKEETNDVFIVLKIFANKSAGESIFINDIAIFYI